MSKYETAFDLDRVVGMLKALSSPQRLRLFLRLVECGAEGAACRPGDDSVRQCVADLAGAVDVAPSTLSHHLKELRQAGLMDVERRGRFLECAVRPEATGLLSAFFADAAARAAGQPRARRGASTR